MCLIKCNILNVFFFIIFSFTYYFNMKYINRYTGVRNCFTCSKNTYCTYSISRLNCQQKQCLVGKESADSLKNFCIETLEAIRKLQKCFIKCCSDKKVFENSPQTEFHRASTDAFHTLLCQGLNKYP